MPDPKVPSNYKDPEKIAAFVSEKKAEQITLAALDPDYGRISTFGWSTDLDAPLCTISATTMAEEATLLKEFWHQYDTCGGKCVGYNVLGFDLPYILKRSMVHRLTVAYPPNLRKFQTEPITDVMAILYGWGIAKGLKVVAKLYGLKPLVEDVCGDEVPNMTPEEEAQYCASDVKLTKDLYALMHGVYFIHNDQR
jgi:hypothetical protein